MTRRHNISFEHTTRVTDVQNITCFN